MSLPELATRRRVTVGMLTVTMVLFGLIALVGLKVNLLPDLSYPTLTVRTEYEGAAPLEIENLISQPVEEAVGVVKNVRKVHSVSRTGQSDVDARVHLGHRHGHGQPRSARQARHAAAAARSEEAAAAALQSVDAIRSIARSALIDANGQDARHHREVRARNQLRRFADDDLKKRIEPVTGVAAVKVGGGLEDEIDVSIDQQQLARLGIDINEVITRLKNENVNASGGRIDEGSQRFLVRTINQFSNLDEMRELPDQGRRQRAGAPQGHRDASRRATRNAKASCASTAARRSSSRSTRKATRTRSASPRRSTRRSKSSRSSLPKGAKLSTIEDQSIFIEHALSEVKFDALLGGVLAILIIFFFLGDAWSTFIISLSLPVSLIATFFFMGQLHLSLNVMSLGGLALATGMVVDDSIVVLENIARLREKGVWHRRSGGARHGRSRHGRDRLDADDGRGVLSARVRAGRRRTTVPRPGADDHVRDADLAGRRDDADSDARFAARPRAARVSRRACRAGAPADATPRAARTRARVSRDRRGVLPDHAACVGVGRRSLVALRRQMARARPALCRPRHHRCRTIAPPRSIIARCRRRSSIRGACSASPRSCSRSAWRWCRRSVSI